MKYLFDTSVLVAAMLTGHNSHAACLPLLQQAQSKHIDGLISTHTLAELYSVLTRIPQTKITPTLAQDLILDNMNTDRIQTTLKIVDSASIDRSLRQIMTSVAEN